MKNPWNQKWAEKRSKNFLSIVMSNLGLSKLFWWWQSHENECPQVFDGGKQSWWRSPANDCPQTYSNRKPYFSLRGSAKSPTSSEYQRRVSCGWIGGWLMRCECVDSCQKASSIYFIFKYVNELDFYSLIYTIPLCAGAVLGAVVQYRRVRFCVRGR